MQTINLLDNHFSDFNAFKVFEGTHNEQNKIGLTLLEQLQTSLDLDILINKFAIEVAKHIDYSGIYFKNAKTKLSARGSRKGISELEFQLKIENEFLGVLTYSINRPLSIHSREMLEQLHQYFLYPLRNALQYQQVLQLAMQDGLTGLGNRRYFDDQLHRAMNHAQRQNTHLCLVVCDLNQFKSINDNYGHQLGDLVLTNFAQALQSAIRDCDSVFRFGGDEFVIMLEDADINSFPLISKRINEAISKDTLLNKYQVSCSLGSTFMQKNDTEQTFFARADQAQYRMKTEITRRFTVV